MSASQHNIDKKQPTLLVMAGGTGGHIFPGLAVADELSVQGWNIHWLGTAERMEAKIVPAHGYDISFIDISGVRHKRLMALVTMPFKLINSVMQARAVIKAVKADVVLGMGGYASAPGGVAAWFTRVPLIVHEQNAAAGLSNRLLSKIANKVCCAFPHAFVDKVDAEVVGNPLRTAIGTKSLEAEPSITELSDSESSVSKESDSEVRKNILVVGGSLGAQALNEIVPTSFVKLFENDTSFSIWHQTGEGKQQAVIDAYAELTASVEGNNSVKITEFITDMADAYHWADIVICRAGALTVSELAMAGKPAIFVPLPHAVDDHQTKNAQYLVKQNAARLLPQNNLEQTNLTKLINELFSEPTTLPNMAKAALAAASSDASSKVAQLCKQLLNKPHVTDEKIKESI